MKAGYRGLGIKGTKAYCDKAVMFYLETHGAYKSKVIVDEIGDTGIYEMGIDADYFYDSYIGHWARGWLTLDKFTTAPKEIK